MAPETPLVDTSDMLAVHEAFRHAFSDASGQLAAIDAGDVARASRLAAYLAEVFWLLHAHHEAEDVLLYPLLIERIPA